MFVSQELVGNYHTVLCSKSNNAGRVSQTEGDDLSRLTSTESGLSSWYSVDVVPRHSHEGHTIRTGSETEHLRL